MLCIKMYLILFFFMTVAGHVWMENSQEWIKLACHTAIGKYETRSESSWLRVLGTVLTVSQDEKRTDGR